MNTEVDVRRMVLRSAIALLCAALGAPAVTAQELDKVPLRVSSSPSGGRAVVDRGTRDLVRKGDPVVLHPRGGRDYRGIVTEVRDRHALVQLTDKSFRPAPGTRGEVLVPKGRAAAAEPERKPPPPAGQTEPEKPVFRNKDEDWQKGMPLLGKARPVRPEERPTRVFGRVYSMGRYADTARDTSSDSFLRLGTDLEVENPFRHGGGLNLDAEYDYRTEQNNVDGHDILLRGFSYHRGGTRFSKSRFEAGRFLQRGMPEFQVLDGVEWGARRENGHRYGASFGFLPEPDDDYESLEDLQIAAYYHWIFGQREELTVSAAIQKSWHNGRADRDLLLAKVQFVPVDAWQFHSTVWIDYYDGKELVRDAGFEITQAYATLSRAWNTGDGVDLTYRRVRFPDIRRNEFQRPLAQRLSGDRYDRLSFASWLSMTKASRLHSELAIWTDEQDSGGSVEAGVESHDVFTKRDRLDVTITVGLGQTSTGAGGRFAYGVADDHGSWDVLYEYGQHHFKSFPGNRNDLAQHLLRASRSFHDGRGWDVTLAAEGLEFDGGLSWSIDFYLQKSF